MSTRIEGNFVTAVIVGPSDGVPSVEDLADQLSDELDKTITVTVSLVVEERITASGR